MHSSANRDLFFWLLLFSKLIPAYEHISHWNSHRPTFRPVNNLTYGTQLCTYLNQWTNATRAVSSFQAISNYLNTTEQFTSITKRANFSSILVSWWEGVSKSRCLGQRECWSDPRSASRHYFIFPKISNLLFSITGAVSCIFWLPYKCLTFRLVGALKC